MSDTVIHIDNISKKYRLGLVGTQTLRGDLQSWWYRIRGKEDPTLKIGEENRLDKQDGEYVWALRDINFEVKQGEVLGIIGKNGAGKSTLLKIISRITAPTSGSIKVKGRIASLLEVGTGFHGELTGRENIFLNGAILGMKKWEIQQKFDEIVDFAGVAKYIDTPVKRYSSGMYVRLAFAVAAHLEPEILIVDEVLAVGDAEFQKKAIGKMQDISQGSGRTVLFVSHNMASVQKLCTRGVLMENGCLTYEGDIISTIDKYIVKDNIDSVLHQFCMNYNISKEIKILSFSFSKAYIKPFEDLSFELSIVCSEITSFDGIAILIYDNNSTRIAVIDLRMDSYLNKPLKSIIISGEIPTLNLVSKEYLIGLAIGANHYSGNIYNLLKLTVLEQDFIGTIKPYPSTVMGYTYIPCSNIKLITDENN